MYLLLILVGFALLGKWLIGDLPADYTNRLLGPSLQHPLGTDFTGGRDTLLQFILGARDVVPIALFSRLFSLDLIGMSIGIVAGFVGGATDKLLMFPRMLF